jgi:hypothetical protein
MRLSRPTAEARARRACAWLLAACLPGAVLAQSAPDADTRADGGERGAAQLDVSVLAGASWSDNIDRVPVDEESGTIASAGLQMSYRQQTRRLDADVDVDAMYQKFQDGDFDDNVVGGMNAALNVGIVPERFLWSFADNFGQAQTDAFGASNPANQENINYFSTGPDVLLHFSSTTQLRLAGRASDVDYENTEADNRRTSGTLTLAHQLSGASTVSLVGESNRIEFDGGLAPTYSRHAGYGRYRLVSTRTELLLDAGYTKLDTVTGGSGGTLARLELNRRMSSAASLALTIGTEFSDASDVLRSAQGLFGPSRNLSNVVAASDPFENRYAIVSFDYFRNRTGCGVRMQRRQELYETATSIDRELTTWNAYVSRQLSARLDARVYADLEKQRAESSGFEGDETRFGGYLNWQLGRTMGLRLEYDRVDRESTDADTEYTEQRATLFLVWTPVSRQ